MLYPEGEGEVKKKRVIIILEMKSESRSIP
jgi:hypothetical protein